MENTFERFVEKFIEEVLSEMDFSGIDDAEKDQLRDLIGQRADKMVIGILLKNLPDDKFKALMAKLDEKDWSESEEQMMFSEALLEVPEFEERLAEGFYDLKKELVDDAIELKNLKAI